MATLLGQSFWPIGGPNSAARSFWLSLLRSAGLLSELAAKEKKQRSLPYIGRLGTQRICPFTSSLPIYPHSKNHRNSVMENKTKKPIRYRFKSRTDAVFRKANRLQKDFNASVAVVVAYGGTHYVYRSTENNWPSMEKIVRMHTLISIQFLLLTTAQQALYPENWLPRDYENNGPPSKKRKSNVTIESKESPAVSSHIETPFDSPTETPSPPSQMRYRCTLQPLQLPEPARMWRRPLNRE